mmetsp:Transcript_80153/g.158780  ORF Transcript_80153/g.158780 Transcript_80153/m.158780 type:complete len:617 (+) Transcript_80153:43-1893(+)
MSQMEWLLFCRGCPSRHGWTHQSRVDALSRCARAALFMGSPCHLLFEDRTLLTLEPDFIGEDGPWVCADAYSERCFAELLENLLQGAQLHGAKWRVPTTLSGCIAEVLESSRFAAPLPPFELLLDFREKGHPLLGQHSVSLPTSAAKAAAATMLQPLPRTLCIIGGVRDVFPSEEQAIETACRELWAARCTISLGPVPELTSKCIKVIGALRAGGCLDAAVRRCLVISASSRKSRGAGEHSIARYSPFTDRTRHARPLSLRPPLHVVVRTSKKLCEFVLCPSVATLLVDVFLASGDINRTTLLTLMDAEGAALTLHVMRRCLAESDALENLQLQLRRARRADLQQVLLDGQRLLHSDVRQLRVLHADESQPPLVPPRVVATPSSALSPSVAVVFWNGGTADPIAAATVSSACSALGVQAYARASVGGLKLGPAFVGVLHNSGLLVPTLCTQPPPQVQCPTVSKSQLLARTVGRTAATAEGVPSIGYCLGSPKPNRSWLHTCSPIPRGAVWPLRGAQATAAVASTKISAAPINPALTHPSSVPTEARGNTSTGVACCAEDVARLAAKDSPVSQECLDSSKDRSVAASTEAPSSECSEHAEDLTEHTSEPLAAGDALC